MPRKKQCEHTWICDYCINCEAIMSEGLAKIEAMSDEELREVMNA